MEIARLNEFNLELFGLRRMFHIQDHVSRRNNLQTEPEKRANHNFHTSSTHVEHYSSSNCRLALYHFEVDIYHLNISE